MSLREKSNPEAITSSENVLFTSSSFSSTEAKRNHTKKPQLRSKQSFTSADHVFD